MLSIRVPLPPVPLPPEVLLRATGGVGVDVDDAAMLGSVTLLATLAVDVLVGCAAKMEGTE